MHLVPLCTQHHDISSLFSFQHLLRRKYYRFHEVSFMLPQMTQAGMRAISSILSEFDNSPESASSGSIWQLITTAGKLEGVSVDVFGDKCLQKRQISARPFCKGVRALHELMSQHDAHMQSFS